MIETFEIYDLVNKQDLIEVKFYLGYRGIVQSHGATYLSMRKWLQRQGEPMGLEERIPESYRDWIDRRQHD